MASGFQFFGFCNNNFFTERLQPCIQPPTCKRIKDTLLLQKQAPQNKELVE
jgi:hypothetical protein